MEPKGIECYVLGRSLDLQFPFSKLLLAQLDSLKPLLAEDTARMEEFDENMDDNGNITTQALEEQVKRFRSLADYTLGEGKVLEAMKKYRRTILFVLARKGSL